ncbi:MAG: SDR family NAD(P)-dependent oxidoreductase [Pseudomonadales bacterium]|jgi:NAD(P)-dependent dehydrogenase (short-subunit alcohol dehydrogenase family)|nr:SDR family NAD(P)-dependent oxidoreductase [Pseudomonadales bacterium]MDP6471500.1 SDR family NAD(P)-dependent oxidoreductase [Pseudomonadales bacterium]MDP6829251.1 SDR family NAD(P)-dependent oxidoreductase [Pseudomonadales bacterium]MDP6970625.1 SDR family NAD(P)-dependent oxidoreductase [Pseudomonadales bacterium]|tara:strand:+ start:564 stop:1328 length:765 start_codon:yes stop_codon:yes gene_type:complete
MFDLTGKHIIITGASSGFGHHFAGVLARQGAAVTLGARRTDKIDARAAELVAEGLKASGAALDVRDKDSIVAFLDAAEAAHGPVDILINNAGVEAGPKTYLMIDEEDWDYVIDINLKGAWLCSKLYTERVLAGGQKGGNIINISSITDKRTIKGQFPYAVSKGAMTRMTEVMALEAARYGIRVNALAPGYVLTNVSRVLLESDQSDEFMKGIPMRRYGEFADLDGPLLLLASDASAYMTGSVLVVDGGHVCASL